MIGTLEGLVRIQRKILSNDKLVLDLREFDNFLRVDRMNRPFSNNLRTDIQMLPQKVAVSVLFAI